MYDFRTLLPDLPFLLAGIPLTFTLATASFLVGSALALPMAVSRTSSVPIVSGLVIAWTEFFLTTPPLVHIMWAYYVLPVAFGIRLSDVTVVIAALAASASAQMSEVFRAGIQSVPKTQNEAAIVLGLGFLRRLRYVTLPQAVRIVAAPACNTLASVTKDTSLAAIIAVPELMNRGQRLSLETFRPLEVLTLIAVLYFVLIYPLILVGGLLEQKSKVGLRTI
jgi:polar amino acid transport system permease protein